MERAKKKRKTVFEESAFDSEAVDRRLKTFKERSQKCVRERDRVCVYRE